MITVRLSPALAVRVGWALRAYAAELRRAGREPPAALLALAADLAPDRVASRSAAARARELAAARARRWRARRRGEDVPLRRPGPAPASRGEAA